MPWVNSREGGGGRGGVEVTSIIKVYTDVRLEWGILFRPQVYEWGIFFTQKYINGVSFSLKKYINR